MMMRRANNHMLVAAGAVDAQCRSWERAAGTPSTAWSIRIVTVPCLHEIRLTTSPYHYADESLRLKQAGRRAYNIRPSVQSDVDIKEGFHCGGRRSAVVWSSIR